MKTVQIKTKKGLKDYVPVSEKVSYLATTYKNRYSLDTHYDYFPERKMWVVKAVLTLTDENGNLQSFTGLAQEVESDDYKQVNFTSALENAETSAIGRACAAAGIGICNGYASADEIQKANRQTMKEHSAERSTYLDKQAEKRGLASVAQKREILLLLNDASVTEHERTAMIKHINSLSKERAEQAISNLKHRQKKYDEANH